MAQERVYVELGKKRNGQPKYWENGLNPATFGPEFVKLSEEGKKLQAAVDANHEKQQAALQKWFVAEKRIPEKGYTIRHGWKHGLGVAIEIGEDQPATTATPRGLGALRVE